MPRIRLLQAVSGADFSWATGQEVDLPAAEASKWADGVRAELVRAAPVERAVKRPAETTKRTRARRTKEQPDE